MGLWLWPNCRRRAKSPCSIPERAQVRPGRPLSCPAQHRAPGNRAQLAAADLCRGRVASLAERSSLARKEIYVSPIFSRAAWSAAAASQLQESLKKLARRGDLRHRRGRARSGRYALGQPRLSAEVLSNRSPLMIQTDLACLGASDQRTVELYLIDADGKPQQRSAESVTVVPGEAQQIESAWPRLTGRASRLFADRRSRRIGGRRQTFFLRRGETALADTDCRSKTGRQLFGPPYRGPGPMMFRAHKQARFDCDIVDLETYPRKTSPITPPYFSSIPRPGAGPVGKNSPTTRPTATAWQFFSAATPNRWIPSTAHSPGIIGGQFIATSPPPEGDLFITPPRLQHRYSRHYAAGRSLGPSRYFAIGNWTSCIPAWAWSCPFPTGPPGRARTPHRLRTRADDYTPVFRRPQSESLEFAAGNDEACRILYS